MLQRRSSPLELASSNGRPGLKAPLLVMNKSVPEMKSLASVQSSQPSLPERARLQLSKQRRIVSEDKQVTLKRPQGKRSMFTPIQRSPRLSDLKQPLRVVDKLDEDLTAQSKQELTASIGGNPVPVGAASVKAAVAEVASSAVKAVSEPTVAVTAESISSKVVAPVPAEPPVSQTQATEAKPATQTAIEEPKSKTWVARLFGGLLGR